MVLQLLPLLLASLGSGDQDPMTSPPPETDIDERETAMLAKVADEEPSSPPPEATVEQHPSTLSAGGQFFLFGKADLRLPGLGAFMDWSPAGKGRYQPSLRAGFLRTLDAQTDDGLAVMLTAGTVGGCPIGIRTTSWLLLSACGDFVAGVVDVGQGLHGRWLGLTGTLRARAESGPWFAALDVAAFVPVAPERFAYRNTSFDETAMALVTLGGGYAWR